jgi:cytochrome oxidase Cu insertion factor (SCO1/SenC/PrrC family)
MRTLKRIMLTAILSFAASAVFAQDSLTTYAFDDQDLQNINFLTKSTFTDIKGKSYTLKDFKGKVVVIHFWESTKKNSVKALYDLYSAHDKYKKDVVVLAVNIQNTDTEERIKNFSEENPYDFIYVPGMDIFSGIRVLRLPYKVILDREGKPVAAFTGIYPDVREYKRNLDILGRCLGK